MSDPEPRRGAANFAPLLMILSFVLMAAFLVWLGMTSEGTEAVPVEERDAGSDADSVELAATPVEPGELGANAASYEGQSVRITAAVASGVGPEAFYLDLPASPFLVKMDSALVASGRRVPQGEVTVTGTVLTMTDSVVSAWSNAGVVSEGDRALVEFATYFLEASRIRETEPDADGGGSDGGGG